MIQLIVGAAIGFFLCSVCWMVGLCLWYERHHPQALVRMRRKEYV